MAQATGPYTEFETAELYDENYENWKKECKYVFQHNVPVNDIESNNRKEYCRSVLYTNADTVFNKLT